MSRSVSQRSAALSATIILGDGLRGTKPDDSLDGERYGYWRDERSADQRGNLSLSESLER